MAMPCLNTYMKPYSIGIKLFALFGFMLTLAPLTAQLTVDPNTGVVTSGGVGNGYTTPSDNNSNSVYEFQESGAAPVISVQPSNTFVCPGGNTNFL